MGSEKKHQEGNSNPWLELTVVLLMDGADRQAADDLGPRRGGQRRL